MMEIHKYNIKDGKEYEPYWGYEQYDNYIALWMCTQLNSVISNSYYWPVRVYELRM